MLLFHVAFTLSKVAEDFNKRDILFTRCTWRCIALDASMQCGESRIVGTSNNGIVWNLYVSNTSYELGYTLVWDYWEMHGNESCTICPPNLTRNAMLPSLTDHCDNAYLQLIWYDNVICLTYYEWCVNQTSIILRPNNLSHPKPTRFIAREVIAFNPVVRNLPPDF